jgi:hypothetical protein
MGDAEPFFHWLFQVVGMLSDPCCALQPFPIQKLLTFLSQLSDTIRKPDADRASRPPATHHRRLGEQPSSRPPAERCRQSLNRSFSSGFLRFWLNWILPGSQAHDAETGGQEDNEGFFHGVGISSACFWEPCPRCWTDTLYARYFRRAFSEINDELFTFTFQMCDDRRRKKWWNVRQASPAFHLPKVISKYHSMPCPSVAGTQHRRNFPYF